MRDNLIILALVATSLLAGCNFLGPSAELKDAVSALMDVSEKCVYDVRDQRLKYEESKNCNALGALSQQYINAGGGRPEAPLSTEIQFERARVHAWMALALSASDGQAKRIW
jgi:hypothetical protein